ncbi:MDR family MFS transporter [Enterococcus rivorum]|uniref:Multidrug MFS transporter n=1 Tax=Enterococcus rivorum TaxID=762845 RepID=A0A1E5L1I1_9ENTE|nr:MDR family MFS transporter [Enterococcus rivorum]MBP2097717.1 EmrB/QacA subfamily drug resistance transporter [Enterococcus rivorum]OEH83988.1 multidrug MFS transporter [Enterococcus rivorum]
MERKTNVKLVTISVFVATFMTAIEGTIVSTAMPTIVGSLQGMEIMNWVFSIYLLTNAMLTPIYGKLADKIGRKPIFIIGIIIFIIGSSLCGLAQNMITLIIARAIQGVGAGAIMPVALTIIGDIYSLDKRAKILGLNSAAWGIASIFGPLAGGFIVDTVGWHWIFFINVPIGIVLLVMISRFLVEPKREKSKVPMDIMGSLLLMTVLLTLLLGFQLIGDGGFDLKVILCLLLSLGLFILFMYVERRAEDPVIDLKLFKNSTFVIVNIVAALISGFLMGVEVYIPMWMQGVLGKNAAIGGLILAPMSLLWMVGSFLASNLMEKNTTRKVLMIGLSITLLGAAGLAFASSTATFVWFLVISSILGIGFGITITTTTVTAQSSVDSSRMGVATSFNTLVRTIGQTLMVAVFGVILTSVTTNKMAASPLPLDTDVMNKLVNPHTANTIAAKLLVPLRTILYEGLHSVYFVGMLIVLLALILNLFFKRKSN